MFLEPIEPKYRKEIEHLGNRLFPTDNSLCLSGSRGYSSMDSAVVGIIGGLASKKDFRNGVYRNWSGQIWMPDVKRVTVKLPVAVGSKGVRIGEPPGNNDSLHCWKHKGLILLPFPYNVSQKSSEARSNGAIREGFNRSERIFLSKDWNLRQTLTNI